MADMAISLFDGGDLMAWGFFFGSTFGKFFPCGEFERENVPGSSKYWKRLDRHYNLQFSDEKKQNLSQKLGGNTYPYYVASKLRSEDGTRYQEMLPTELPARVIEPHELPRSFDIERHYKTLGDIFETNDRILAVSEHLKDVIESFEAGVHQFFPIVVTDPIKGDLEKKYYVFILQNYLDSFRSDQSVESSFERDMYMYRFDTSKAGIEGLALAKDVFAGHHIWAERRFTGTLFCLSNELQAAIIEAGLAIPKHYRVKEV